MNYFKTAVITGASTGVGAASAKLLAKNGFYVIAISRNLKLMQDQFVGIENIEPYQLDITDYKNVDKFFQYIQNKNIDVFISNAGSKTAQPNYIENSMSQSWTDTFEGNVVAPMYMCQKFIPNMKKNKFGKIIFITSFIAYNPAVMHGAYASSKRAQLSLVETLRKELSSYGITVSQIAPGSIDTEPEKIKPASLKSEDVAEAIRWISMLPNYVNIDTIDIAHIENLKYS